MAEAPLVQYIEESESQRGGRFSNGCSSVVRALIAQASGPVSVHPCLSVHLSVHLSLHPSVCYLSICLFTFLFICSSFSPSVSSSFCHLSIRLFIFLSICSSFCPSVIFPSVCSSSCPSVNRPIHLSVHLSVHLLDFSSICLFILLSIHLSIRLFIFPFVCLFILLSVCSLFHYIVLFLVKANYHYRS